MIPVLFFIQRVNGISEFRLLYDSREEP